MLTVVLMGLAFVCAIFGIVLAFFTDSVKTKYDYYYLKMDKKRLKMFKRYLMICNFGEVFIACITIVLIILALHV